MKVFVTGGAGYIGAHVAYRLREMGHEPIVVDDFRKSKRERARDFTVEELALEDAPALFAAFEKHKPDAIIHLAGYISVGESVQKPQIYWENNLGCAMNLLIAAARYGLKSFLFSSTAAVYGDVEKTPIDEDAPKQPTCPYGDSKYAFEKFMHANAKALGIKSFALRYFNASGAWPEWGVGEDHEPEEHLIPRIIAALKAGKKVQVYGNDYPTPDGTCVRDYVHVRDLATAHVKVIEQENLEGGQSFNIGSGSGFSVLEIIQTVGAQIGIQPDIDFLPRRPGDPASLVANASKLCGALNWKPEHSSVEEVVSTAIAWDEIRKKNEKE